MRRLRAIVGAMLALLLLGLTACNNACQDLCHDMAKFAENECGYTVPDEQIDACIDRQAGVDGDDRRACRQNDDDATIEAEWGCEELADYFE